MAERHRLVLVLGAVTGREADLAQGVFEAGLFGGLRELLVVVEAQSVRCSILLTTRPPLTFGTQ
jgi:hypothetical protein